MEASSPPLSTRASRAPRAVDPVALAAQHLLRHLDDPVALGRNRLVSSLFDQGDGARLSADAMNRIHALIRQCAERLRTDSGPAREGRESRERQYQILMRCDLGREPHGAVAGDLALSRRQFYRERREASGYLARFLVEYARERAARPHAVSLDPFALELSRAKALRLAGEAGRSEAVLRELIASVDGVARKIEPWCALVDILINCNRIDEAESEFQLAQAALSGSNGVSRSATAPLQARLDMQRASYLWFQGLTRETAELDARTEGAVERMSHLTSPDAHEFYATTRLRQVQCELMIGTIDRARADIERVRAFLASADDIPLSVKINSLIISGDVKDHMPGASDEAFALLTEALALAQRHGLIELVIEAMGQLSSNAQLRGDHASGMRYVYEVLPIAERFALPAQHGWLLNVAAISEASLGHNDAAIGLATRARQALASNSLESIYSSLAEAQARLSTRGFALAAAAAQDAHAAAGRIRSDRLAGTALRLMGESHAGLGQAESAREYLLGAVACLEREGPPYALLQAYQAAARVTGDRQLRSRASELGAALKR
jgi:tetratricopeptide (TPR) repeat protein